MNTKSRTTDALAELASNSRLLNRKIVDLVYLRQLVADKESAANVKIEEMKLRSSQISLPINQTGSTHELPEKSRKFLESFLADEGPLLLNSKDGETS
jgi:hypothetical protein